MMNQKKRILFARALKNLQDIGFWTKDGKRIPFIFFNMFFVLGAVMILGLIGHMYKSVETDRISEFLNDLFFLLIGTFVSATALILYIRRNETLKFYHKLNNKYGKSKEFEPLMSHLEKMTSIVYYYSLTGNIIFLIFTYFSDHECFQRKKDGVGDGYICGLMFPAWLPVDLDFTPWKQFIHLIQFVEIIYIAPKLAGACIFFYGGIVITERRIQKLNSFIKNIRVSKENRTEVLQSLRDAVKDYADINELVNDINSTIGVIFSPSQHVLLGLVISLLEFQAVVEKKENAIPTLIFWFLFESLTCWKGQSLEDASVSLAEQVYEFPWYDLDPAARSIFKIFYGQVRVTLQLKCPPIIIINFSYFYEVMKGSYSFLMYLQKLY